MVVALLDAVSSGLSWWCFFVGSAEKILALYLGEFENRTRFLVELENNENKKHSV